MASSINKVILLGRLGQEPEIKTMQNGGKLAKLSVATSEKWKDKNTGEVKENTDWHKVVVYHENIVNYIENYVHKGDLVYLEGQSKTRVWEDRYEEKRYITEIVLKGYSCVFKGLGNNTKNEGQHVSRPVNHSNHNDLDDEIPF